MARYKPSNHISWHHSYGFATLEQIEKLRTLGDGAERAEILKQVKKQNEERGTK